MIRFSNFAARLTLNLPVRNLIWSAAVAPLFALTIGCGQNVIGVAAASTGGEGDVEGTSATSTGGTEVKGDSPQLSYTAKNRFGLFKRYAIVARTTDQGRCVRILLLKADPKVGLPVITIGIKTSTGWAVEQADITNDVADCAFSGGDTLPAPHGKSAKAIGGSGSIKADESDIYHPTLSIHAQLLFTAGSTFPPASVDLAADELIPVD